MRVEGDFYPPAGGFGIDSNVFGTIGFFRRLLMIRIVHPIGGMVLFGVFGARSGAKVFLNALKKSAW